MKVTNSRLDKLGTCIGAALISRRGRCPLSTDGRDPHGIASSWLYNAGVEKLTDMTREELLSRITISPRVP